MIRSIAVTLLIGFNFLSMAVFAQTADIFSVGLNANYTNESTFGGELFLKKGIKLFCSLVYRCQARVRHKSAFLIDNPIGVSKCCG